VFAWRNAGIKPLWFVPLQEFFNEKVVCLLNKTYRFKNHSYEGNNFIVSNGGHRVYKKCT